MGCAVTTLRYNTDKKTFEPIGAEYVPMGYFGWDKLLQDSAYIPIVN